MGTWPEYETFSNHQAVALKYTSVALGTDQTSIAEGQELFARGKRSDWKLR